MSGGDVTGGLIKPPVSHSERSSAAAAWGRRCRGDASAGGEVAISSREKQEEQTQHLKCFHLLIAENDLPGQLSKCQSEAFPRSARHQASGTARWTAQMDVFPLRSHTLDTVHAGPHGLEVLNWSFLWNAGPCHFYISNAFICSSATLTYMSEINETRNVAEKQTS